MAKKEENESFGKWLLDVIVIMLVIMGIYYLLFHFVLSNESVSGPSMQPTFESNDRVIAIRHGDLKRNDIVILKAPDQKGALYIKRVIGLPGETVASKNDKLYINGKQVPEPYLNNKYARRDHQAGRLYTFNFNLKNRLGVNRVPKNCYFVMGDHRDVSNDSRYFGFVKRDAIVGIVKFRYWPLNQMRGF
jgi:signal peptidase I